MWGRGRRWMGNQVTSSTSSYIAVDSRDRGVQRHRGVPGSSLRLCLQHPDASRGVPVQVRNPQAAWARSFL